MTSSELSTLQLLILLPYEMHTLLIPHLPLLLHTCVVCYGPESSSVLSGAPHAQANSSSLLLSLMRNVALRSQSLPPAREQLAQFLAHGRQLKVGLSAIPQLLDMFSSVSPPLRAEWRELSLHWALHALDPDISLTSLRTFTVLVASETGEWCSADLFKTLYAQCETNPAPNVLYASLRAHFVTGLCACGGRSVMVLAARHSWCCACCARCRSRWRRHCPALRGCYSSGLPLPC